MSKDGRIWLSHSGIETMQRCPRCFWLQYKRGLRQPEGIVSRLANRFDIILKNHFDEYRKRGEMPPLVKGKLEGRLELNFQEKYFVRINEKYGFLGKLDECLINDEGAYVPVDFKTASSDPRQKETLAAYQSQIDDYNFIIRDSGKKIAGYGYLVYVYPDESKELHKGFPMIIHVVKLEGNPENTLARINDAIEVLNGLLPASSENCPFCKWYIAMKSELGENGIPQKSTTSFVTPVQQEIF